jgi:tetratricopeptide (TPR) repeat protein
MALFDLTFLCSPKYFTLSGKEILRTALPNLKPPIVLLTALATLGSCIICGCASKVVPEPQYRPAGDLLDIIKDFQRLSRDDLYRFPIPKDVSGVNIMKATLVRLDDYEKKNPGRFTDIIQFAKGTAYEKLRDYDQAAIYYSKVAESDGQLAAEAAKNLSVLEHFKLILQKPLSAQDPFEYMKGLDEKVSAWNELIQENQGTPYEYLARVEEEKIDRAKITFVELNRYRLKDGNQLVILGYTQLITKHRQSKNLHRYILDFGDFYVELAKEYATQNDPEGLTYDAAVFDQLAKSALRLYTEVVQVDGIVEKIEAQGKIDGVRALMEKMRRLNR